MTEHLQYGQLDVLWLWRRYREKYPIPSGKRLCREDVDDILDELDTAKRGGVYVTARKYDGNAMTSVTPERRTELKAQAEGLKR